MMDPRIKEGIFDRLDVLLTAKDGSQFAIGDLSNELLDLMVKEDNESQEERVPLRTILTALLDEMAGRRDGNVDVPGRFSNYFTSVESARDRIATYIRITRFFDIDRRAELPSFLKFSHYSAIYVGDKDNWPNVNEAETMKWLNWALENKAQPWQIYAAKMGRENETYEQRYRRIFVQTCMKYISYYEGGEPELYNLACRVQEYVNKNQGIGQESMPTRNDSPPSLPGEPQYVPVED